MACAGTVRVCERARSVHSLQHLVRLKAITHTHVAAMRAIRLPHVHSVSFKVIGGLRKRTSVTGQL